MICYLVRHGKDDDSVRGGWSDTPLTHEGVTQVKKLAGYLSDNPQMNIGFVYTSDLIRAKQTAEILAFALSLPVEELPKFREVNNGVLAGMNNEEAARRYPGLYWNTLDWEESYPEGESPAAFFRRISDAWKSFRDELQCLDRNAILVTHGGVINVIRCIENGISWSHKVNSFSTKNADIVPIELK